MHYLVRKLEPGIWQLSRVERGSRFYVARYKSKRAAVLAGRLLAGWAGVVTVI